MGYTLSFKISVTDPMNGLALRLVATRCLDGVEIIRRNVPPGALESAYGVSGEVWFSYRSDRYQRETIRDMPGLEDALVVRFVNATDDKRRLAFLSRFGLPLHALRYEPYEFVLGEQRILRSLLDRAGSGDSGIAIKAANESLRGAASFGLSLQSDGRMVFTTEIPITFMHVEVAMVAASGARVATCECCGDLFLTGASTARRSTARYCRDRCRVNAHRARMVLRK